MKKVTKQTIENRILDSTLIKSSPSGVDNKWRIELISFNDENETAKLSVGRIHNSIQFSYAQLINLTFGNSVINNEGETFYIKIKGDPKLYDKILKEEGYSYEEIDASRIKDAESIVEETQEQETEEEQEDNDDELIELINQYNSIDSFIFDNKEYFLALTSDKQSKVIEYFENINEEDFEEEVKKELDEHGETLEKVSLGEIDKEEAAEEIVKSHHKDSEKKNKFEINPEYKYFIFDIKEKSILTGWEFKEDAENVLEEQRSYSDEPSNLTIYTKRQLTSMDIDFTNIKNWLYNE